MEISHNLFPSLPEWIVGLGEFAGTFGESKNHAARMPRSLVRENCMQGTARGRLGKLAVLSRYVFPKDFNCDSGKPQNYLTCIDL